MGSHCVANSEFVEKVLMRDRRVALDIIRPSAVPYENNLNRVIKLILESDYDYWLNIDDDQAPIANPLDLIQLDKDIIGCPTPSIKLGQNGKHPFFWSVYSQDSEGYRPYVVKPNLGNLQEVDAVGSGCMLVARRVLEVTKQPMLRRYDEFGMVSMGADLSFCNKAKSQGFKIWAHYDYLCSHYRAVDILEVMRAIAGASNDNI
jgi:hypothetical protein